METLNLVIPSKVQCLRYNPSSIPAKRGYPPIFLQHCKEGTILPCKLSRFHLRPFLEAGATGLSGKPPNVLLPAAVDAQAILQIHPPSTCWSHIIGTSDSTVKNPLGALLAWLVQHTKVCTPGTFPLSWQLLKQLLCQAPAIRLRGQA